MDPKLIVSLPVLDVDGVEPCRHIDYHSRFSICSPQNVNGGNMTDEMALESIVGEFKSELYKWHASLKT